MLPDAVAEQKSVKGFQRLLQRGVAKVCRAGIADSSGLLQGPPFGKVAESKLAFSVGLAPCKIIIWRMVFVYFNGLFLTPVCSKVCFSHPTVVSYRTFNYGEQAILVA